MTESELFRLMTGMLILATSSSALGASGDFVSISANVTSVHDDNLFRRPADGSLGAVASDRVTTTQVGIGFHKALSLQVFDLNMNIVDNKYKDFKSLDSRNDGYSAAWHWQITPRLTGNLSSDRQKSQTDFADFRGAGQNLRTTESRRFDANWNLVGGWTVGAGATGTKAINSQAFTQDASNEQRIGEISLKYAFSSGTSLTLAGTKSNGDYGRPADPVTLSDSRFSDQRNELRLDWPLTGKTKLAANYGRVSRKHETFSVRDYAGNVGNISLSWAATGKSSLSLGHVRSLESWEDTASSFSRRSTTSLSGKWQASPKLLMSASFDRETRTMGGFAIIPLAVARLDNTDKASVALNWAVMQNMTIATSIQKSRRRSNSPGLDYDDRLVTINASVSF